MSIALAVINQSTRMTLGTRMAQHKDATRHRERWPNANNLTAVGSSASSLSTFRHPAVKQMLTEGLQPWKCTLCYWAVLTRT